MWNILKQHKNNTILHMYRVVTLDEAKSFNPARLIDIVLNNLFCSEPTSYYITGSYPSKGWTTQNGFLKAVIKKEYRDICHLLIANKTIHFSFENWLLNDAKPNQTGYQAIEFYAQEDIYTLSDMETFARNFCEVFPIDYGFVFSLPDNYDPSSEQKIRKGIFSESVAVNSRDVLWTHSITKVKDGFLKNIYPVNFINDTVFKRQDFQKHIVENGIGSFDHFYTGVKKWTLDPDEVEKARFELLNSDLLF